MIRDIVRQTAILHDAIVPSFPGERGIDHLDRSMKIQNQRHHRRFRREEGKFPWCGLGWLWRWLYVPYHRQIAAEDKLFTSNLPMSEFVRESLRRQVLERKIGPPSPIPDDLLSV